MISYQEDPLFNTKNMYACLVKPAKDFKDKNFCLRTPVVTLTNKNKIISQTKKKYGAFNKGFLFFIKGLEEYIGIKFSSVYKAKYRYLQLFKNNQVNIAFLRVISLCLSDKLQNSIKLFEDFAIKNNTIIINKLKLKVSDFGRTIYYLAGVISGDGHLNKEEHGQIVISDGQSDKNKLKYSQKYLKFINNLFKKEFNLYGEVVEQKTWWNYYLNNKWLCRFINYYLEIPYGKKSAIVKLPEVLYGLNERYFWRGVMDTDGFISHNKKQIHLKTNSLTLLNQLKDFCNKNSIQIYTKKEKRGWSLRIFSNSFLNYAKLIGSSHPRKSKNLVYHLKKGSYYKIFKNFKNGFSDDEEFYKHLRPYKNVVYISFSKNLTKTDKKDVKRTVNKIKNKFQVKVIEIKRKRHNNHYCICSKPFSEFLKKNCVYDLPWKPLNSKEIIKIKGLWEL